MKSLPLIFKIAIGIVILFGIGALIYALLPKTNTSTSQQNKTQALVTQPPTPTVAPEVLQSETDVLANVAVWAPSVPWTKPQHTAEDTTYGNLPGSEIHATVTSDQASYPTFEQKDQLTKLGFTDDLSSAAGGPGSSMWGYRKDANGQTQVLLFSYDTDYPVTTPDQPIEFTCPCQVNLSVFLSDPFATP